MTFEQFERSITEPVLPQSAPVRANPEVEPDATTLRDQAAAAAERRIGMELVLDLELVAEPDIVARKDAEPPSAPVSAPRSHTLPSEIEIEIGRPEW